MSNLPHFLEHFTGSWIMRSLHFIDSATPVAAPSFLTSGEEVYKHHCVCNYLCICVSICVYIWFRFRAGNNLK